MASKEKDISSKNIETLGKALIYMIVLLLTLFLPGVLSPDSWPVATWIKDAEYTPFTIAFYFISLIIICIIGQATNKDIRIAITVFLGIEVIVFFTIVSFWMFFAMSFKWDFFPSPIICFLLNALLYALLVYSFYHKEIKNL